MKPEQHSYAIAFGSSGVAGGAGLPLGREDRVMSTKHTPVPWVYKPGHPALILAPGPRCIASIAHNSHTDANGRLMAAAPDLYAALKRAFDFVQCERGCSAFTGHGDVCTCGARNVELMIRAALRKADGTKEAER